MKLKLFALIAALLTATTFAVAADTMTGYISDSHCGAQGAKARHEECATKCATDHGAKCVFVNDGDHKVCASDDQQKVAAHTTRHRERGGGGQQLEVRYHQHGQMNYRNIISRDGQGCILPILFVR